MMAVGEGVLNLFYESLTKLYYYGIYIITEKHSCPLTKGSEGNEGEMYGDDGYDFGHSQRWLCAFSC